MSFSIAVSNKCKEDFSMVIPGVGIFFAEAGNVENTYIFYNEFKNGPAVAAVGGSNCASTSSSSWDESATGPCTTAVFNLVDGNATAHIDLVPPRKFNHPLRMTFISRSSRLICAAANCTTAARKKDDIKRLQITDTGELTGMVLEFCY
ncbi:hypothetical protein PCANC_14685 [Puccinia coronata f. sp. avenae]|uniref:Uncharacterized protein n=1 Tax=Puccinia coronata f. sp. avenae TaxID=200324 RepID=A0A2N5UCG4_9BASI|nr:hypothetical protein PCANC_17013 [Puccinia coronata f. sp. avenae]PLW35443.1 hypothetical protein PCANC_14685 [Puccinia coronata f. sp. avenae]